MKTRFKSTETTATISAISLCVMILSMMILPHLFDDIIPIFAVIAVCIAVCGICFACRGEITADERGVTVVTTFFGKEIREKTIEYGSIESTKCFVETIYHRNYSCYNIVLRLNMRDGSKFSVFNRLDISRSFPASQPDEYKKYLSQQPLMKLSHYIDSKLHLNASA